METTNHGRNMDWITMLGVLILLGGLVYTGIGVHEWLLNRHVTSGATSGWLVGGMVFASGAGMCVTGLLTIALSEFIAFVGPRQKPGWVLRNASKALFMLAGLRVLSTAFSVLYLNESQAALSWAQKFPQHLLVTAAGAVGVIILITLGLAVARVLPVIEESKAII